MGSGNQERTLEEIRGLIDQCDRELVKLLEERFSLVEQVAEIKAKGGISIYHGAREQAVIERVLGESKNPKFHQALKQVFWEIISASKGIQSRSLLPRHIILIGFMGAGKTTVGKGLSKMLGLPFVDLDEAIVAQEGMSVSQIFEEKGEAAFRELEAKMLRQILQGEGGILSCGGGIILNPDNITCLKEAGAVFWLRAQPDTLYQRLRGDTGRPLLKDKLTLTYIDALLTERWGKYLAAADHMVETDGRSTEEIGEEIIKMLMSSSKG